MTVGAVRFLQGGSLMQRAFRSSAFTMAGFAGSQILRLGSNLILTRLLFPEAFGLMAMVSVFLMGLNMFSDVGVGPAIMQSKRGDDRDFLNTAWTIQIMRGVLLYIVACALAWPIAQYFGEPDLTLFLPVAAVTLVVQGLYPTRLETANRHLQAGRVTLIELASQVVSIATALYLAWLLQSVWALVISGIVSTLCQLLLLHLFLPGQRNRLNWEPAAAQELISFGKWIFLSTVCGFVIGQADKVVIGGYLSTYDFGIYNIGYVLAALPLTLGLIVTRRVLIPIYRDSPPTESRENFLRLRRMRVLASAALLGGAALMAFGGVWLIDLMYDSRYQLAGGIVVLVSVSQMPALIVITYDQAALAVGESRRYFFLAVTRAILILTGMVFGLMFAGLPGALAGQGLALILAYPAVIWLARGVGAWDPLHDLGFFGLAVGLGGLALWVNWPAIARLATLVGG